jgi:hypothetical protein
MVIRKHRILWILVLGDLARYRWVVLVALGRLFKRLESKVAGALHFDAGLASNGFVQEA